MMSGMAFGFSNNYHGPIRFCALILYFIKKYDFSKFFQQIFIIFSQ